MMVPSSFIQELIARSDVVELVGRQVQLKKAGINYKGLCPFHGEKSPSFIVSPSRQTYHCFGCGVHGDAIRFLTDHHGMSFIEAVRDLAQQVGLTLPEDESTPEQRAQASQQRERQSTQIDVLTKAAEHYRSQLKATPRAIDYLKQRGLSGEIAARFGLGYAPEGWKGLASVFPSYDDPLLAEAGLVIVQGEDGAEQNRYDRFRDRIMFPIRSVKGEIIAFGGRVLDRGEPKYLNSPETAVFVKGRELYGLFEARTSLREQGYVLVTEGYMDVVALAQLGCPNAVATLGTACSAEHVQKLLRFTDQVVFSFDGDAAGRRAAGRALEAALPFASDTRSFRFLFLPAEHDPDSFIRERGKEAFDHLISQAVPLSRQLAEHAGETCDMATLEGRSKMLAQARPLWSLLPEGTLRLQLLGELARRAGLPVNELAHSWQAAAGRARTPGTAGNGLSGVASGGSRNVRRAGLRTPPKRPEDCVVQILFGQPAWWEQISAEEHDLLHALPAPHGLAIGWLERNIAEHGVRPWAVLRHALSDDELLTEDVRRLASTEGDPDATLAELRRSLDHLILRDLEQRKASLLGSAAADPGALDRYRVLDQRWKEVKLRQSLVSDNPD
jgi:DNA primase